MLPRLRLLLLGLLLLAAIAAAGAERVGLQAQGSGPNRAAVVVQFGNGEAFASCVSFSEPSISGYDLLRRSGLIVLAEPGSSMGAAVCKISDARRQNGCEFPADDCFCQCTNPSGDCQYWAYYHMQNGNWSYSDVGAGGWQVSNGMMDGWAWGEGEINRSGAVPPLLSFDQVCVSAQASPTPTPTQVPVLTSTPTPTFTPTSTSTPTATPTPSPTGTVFTATPTPTLQFTLTPTPLTTSTAATATPAFAMEFSVQPEIIGIGACTTLRWNVPGAEAVFLKQSEGPEQSVSQASTLTICPEETTSYALRAVAGATQQVRAVVVQVLAAGTPVPTLTPTPTGLVVPGVTAEIPAPLVPSPDAIAATPVVTGTPESAEAAIVTVTPPPPAGGPGATARPMILYTPVPTPASSSGSPARILLGIGGFALLLAAVAGAGLWALSRQSSSRRPPPPPPPPPAPPSSTT